MTAHDDSIKGSRAFKVHIGTIYRVRNVLELKVEWHTLGHSYNCFNFLKETVDFASFGFNDVHFPPVCDF